MLIDIRKMEGALKELHAIVFSDDGFHTPIENTILYQAVQNADCLSVDGLDIYADSLDCPPEVLLLIAKIAATSPTLHTVNMRFINIAEYGPDAATALANSNSIAKVNMSGNDLAEHGPDTVASLTNSNSIHFIYYS